MSATIRVRMCASGEKRVQPSRFVLWNGRSDLGSRVRKQEYVSAREEQTGGSCRRRLERPHSRVGSDRKKDIK